MELNLLSEEFFDDPYPTYRWLRDEAPSYHNDEYGFWALSRFDDVLAAHRDWRTFSNEHGLRLDQLKDPENRAAKQNIIWMDPPDHERMRKLVSRAFTPRAISAIEPIAHAVIGRYLDGLAGAGRFDGWPTSRRRFPSRSSRRCSACPTVTGNRSDTSPTRSCSAVRTTRTPHRRAWRRCATGGATSATWSPKSASIPATT